MPATLADEVDLDGRRERTQHLATAKELDDRLATLVAVVLSHVVDVHRDEAVGNGGVDPTSELERVLERLRAVVEPALDRFAQDLRDVGEDRVSEVAADDAHAQREPPAPLQEPPPPA